jgi:hypothetical protein
LRIGRGRNHQQEKRSGAGRSQSFHTTSVIA